MITQAQLVEIFPHAKLRASVFLAPLNAAMVEFEINTPIRIQMFLAQIGHESGELRYVQEIATGAAYESRKDLGNINPGDGKRYKGRGLIQLTGLSNYTAMQADMGIPCVAHPELLETPVNACRSAGWFWKRTKLNEIADTGDFVKVTKRINGGTNGLPARLAYFERAKKVIK